MLPKCTHLVILWLIYGTSEVAAHFSPFWDSSCGIAPKDFQIPGLLFFGLPFPGQSCCTVCPERRENLLVPFLVGHCLFPSHFTILLLHFSMTWLNQVCLQPPQEAPFLIHHGHSLVTPRCLSCEVLFFSRSPVLDINFLIMCSLRTMVLLRMFDFLGGKRRGIFFLRERFCDKPTTHCNHTDQMAQFL